MTSRELITALRIGMPVSAEAGIRLLTPAACEAIQPALARVSDLRVMPLRDRATFWITGHPGNGKTQCLIKLQEGLRKLPGSEKHASVHIRFDQEREIGRQAGLHITLHFPFAGVAVGEIGNARDAAHQLSRAFQSVAVDALALGLDAVFRSAGIPIPLATGAKHVLRKATGWEYVQRKIVRRKLQNRWPLNPALVDFAMHWASYLMTPTPAQRARFRDCINSHGPSSFDLLCSILEQGGYTTLVVILDETRFDAIEGLKALMDGPVRDQNPSHKLNLVFVLACPDSERQRVLENPSLSRRFCATDGGHSLLRGPSVESGGNNNDLEHAFKSVEELLNQDASILRRSVTANDRDRLRQTLVSFPNLTWQVLWKRVIDLMVQS